MGCGVSHRGEEGSVGVLEISDPSIRSGAEYARICDERHDASVLRVMGSSLARGNPPSLP